MNLLRFFLICYSTLFAIMDPVGVAAAFVPMTERNTREEQLRMALIGSLTAGGVLMFFFFGGKKLFDLLGISQPAFQVAGGIILLLVALDMLQARRVALRTSREEENAGVMKEDIAITPLAIPLLAGPGAISATLVLGSRSRGLSEDLILVLAILAMTLTSYFALRWALVLGRLLGTLGTRVLERLVGLILAALAVEFILSGVGTLLVHG